MRLKLEKREKLPFYTKIIIPVVCVLIALLFCGILMKLMGHNPLEAYQKMVKGSMGSARNLSESVLQSIPLMLCALGVSISFKMSVNNIGAEGQYVMGAWAATGIALYCPWIAGEMTLPTMIVMAFVAGAIWAVVGVLPKILWGVNETIITLMLNYVALFWLDYWCYGSWRDTAASNLPFSKSFDDFARLGTLYQRVHVGIFIALIAAVAIFLFFRYTSSGYQIRVIGINRAAANYGGMNVHTKMILVMACSGGLAGLAGLCQVAGTVGQLQPDIAGGAGYTAIIIAYLAKFNPFYVLLVSLLFGCMDQGGFSIQLLNISINLVTLLQGTILLAVLGGEMFTRYRVTLRKDAKEVAVK